MLCEDAAHTYIHIHTRWMKVEEWGECASEEVELRTSERMLVMCI